MVKADYNKQDYLSPVIGTKVRTLQGNFKALPLSKTSSFDQYRKLTRDSERLEVENSRRIKTTFALSMQ